MALIAGTQAAPGRTMGHAGAFVGPGESDAASKARELEKAGAILTNHPSKFGERMKALLEPNPGDKLQVQELILYFLEVNV